MSTISDKIFKLETPVSESDSNYEDYEYMLAWYGRNGSFYSYLFTDWEQLINVSATVLNITDADKISSIISDEKNGVTLVVEDISRNDLIELSSIFITKKVIRIYKDETIERVAIKSNSKAYRQTNGRYNLEIKIAEHQKPLPR